MLESRRVHLRTRSPINRARVAQFSPSILAQFSTVADAAARFSDFRIANRPWSPCTITDVLRWVGFHVQGDPHFPVIGMVCPHAGRPFVNGARTHFLSSFMPTAVVVSQCLARCPATLDRAQ